MHGSAGLHAFSGPIFEAAIRALASGPLAADALFGELCRIGNPTEVMADISRLRTAGVLGNEPTGQAVQTSEMPDGAILTLFTELDRLAVHGDWFPVELTPQRAIVGPMISTRAEPCRTCLAERARKHDDLGRLLRAYPAEKLSSFSLSPAKKRAVLEFLRQSGTELKALSPGQMCLWDFETDTRQYVTVCSVGGCQVCKEPPARLAQPGIAAKLRGGGYRPLSADDFLKQISGQVDPVSGIIRDIAPLPKAPAAEGLSHVVLARHAFPLAAPDLAATMRNRQGRSAGKGRTPADAKASAVAEAFERYAGVARPDDANTFARAADLDGSVILPEEWALYSPAQFANATAWRALKNAAAYVPDQANGPVHWTRVTNHVDGAQGWAPSALCWHQFNGRSNDFLADSNGCAAGQTMEDALLQALFELIERDAVAIWWWNRIYAPRLPVVTLQDPWIERVADLLETLGFGLHLLNLTHDLGVPVIAAVADPVGGTGPLLFGFGAHVSGGVAASRAVSEVLQALPDRPAMDVGGRPWDLLGRIPNHTPVNAGDFDFLTGTEPTHLPQTAVPETASEALQLLTESLTRKRLQIWTLDQSRPDVPIPIVRAIVPGLRPFRPRFAKGRLQSVPLELGLRWQGRNPFFIPQ